MDFGLMFFASESGTGRAQPYRLMLDAARVADRRGFRCIWTPERHFDRFGGLFPNPAITSAALATVTERIQLRAGSAITPLHDVLRLAEDWAMVDNLSGGRVALSFGSGWNVNDFVFFPQRYAERQAVMLQQIEALRTLWRGAPITRANGAGQDIEVTLQPAPVRPDLPVWITSSGNPRTFALAGTHGANLLTHLLGQDLTTIAANIQLYRRARQDAGHDAGLVSLMLHTFVAESDERARDAAFGPLYTYLSAAADLEQRAAHGGGTISCGRELPDDPAEPDDPELRREMIGLACERYLNGASLIGSPASCAATLDRLRACGVDEIACLIDFGVADDDVLAALEPLDELRRASVANTSAGASQVAAATHGGRLSW